MNYLLTKCGDFNMPEIKSWSYLNFDLPSRETYLANFIIDNGLHQLVIKPTHMNAILYLFITNDKLSILNLR